MTQKRKLAALLLAVLAGVAAAAYARAPQTPAASPAQTPLHVQGGSNLILLDPAHGGPDSGANLGNNLLEKNLTLRLASKIRPALALANFNVISTRDSDVTTPLANDQRAAIANRLRPLACLILHGTATGSGVHLYTSALPPSGQGSSDSSPGFLPTPWDSAQAGFVQQSHQLALSFASTLSSAGIPVISGTAPVAPLDNMMCPAVIIEIAPLPDASVEDNSYESRVVAALARATRSWQTQLSSAEATRPTPRSSP